MYGSWRQRKKSTTNDPTATSTASPNRKPPSFIPVSGSTT